MAQPKLSVRNLSKVYRRPESDLVALDDVSLDVAEGEFVSIVGASGCGKTTLLKLINGLIKPTSGHVEIDGKISERPDGDVAFVFQQDGLFPWRTIKRNVTLGPEIRGTNAREAARSASEMLALVGLGGFESHYPHELSGGMKQRVNIARALTAGGDILLMDEPFAALDAQTREIMQAELMRICKDAGKTVLLVTHQIDEAVYLSDRVVVLTTRPGRLKEEVKIEMDRPRELSAKRTPEFIRYTDHIWRAIEEEVRESIKIETRSISAVSA